MTAIVTAEQLVGGLAARIENGVDANYEGDNKRLKDAMVAQNFFTGGSGGGVAGVSSVNGATGAVTLTAGTGITITGTTISATGTGGGTAGVASFNGRTGTVALSAEDVTGALTTPLPINKGGTGATTATGAINALLPGQAGNAGKVLSTNGSSAQWVTATGGSGTDRVVYVQDFGAVGDGVTNDTAAFQAAIDSLGTNGGVVRAVGKFLITGTVTLNPHTFLTGDFRMPGPGTKVTENDPPTAYHEIKSGTLVLGASATLRLMQGAGLDGLLIYRSGMQFPVANPSAYSGTAVTIQGDDASVKNSFITGFNKGIYSDGYQRPQVDYVFLDNVNGVEIARCYDIATISNCHAWPFSTIQWGTDYVKDMRSGVAFHFRDVNDWGKVYNCFSYGYGTGFKLNNVNNMVLMGCGTDGPWEEKNIVNGSPVRDPWGALNTGSVGFHILGSSDETVLVGCQSAAQGRAGVLINTTLTDSNSGSGRHVTLQSHSVWGTGQHCVLVESGHAIINSSIFRGLRSKSSASALRVVNNQSRVTVDNCVFKDLQTSVAVSCNTTSNAVEVRDSYIDSWTGTGNPWGTSLVVSSAKIGAGSGTQEHGVYIDSGSSSLDITTAVAKVVRIPGASNIGNIRWGTKGRELTLIFDGNSTVYTAPASGAGVGDIKLAGGVNYTATAGSVLSLIHDGTIWRETARNSTGSGGGGTAGVTSLNGQTGAVTLTAGTGISISGTTISTTGTGTGAGTVTSMSVNATSPITASITNPTTTPTLALSHATSGVSASSYGTRSTIPVITVNNTGHITSVTTQTVHGQDRFNIYSSGTSTEFQSLNSSGSTFTDCYASARIWAFSSNAAVTGSTLRLDANKYALVGYEASNGAYRLQVNGSIYATSSTIATSDARYKENVKPITNALDIVERLNPVEFSWKPHPVHDFSKGVTVGFIAQEVELALQGTDYANSIVRTNQCQLPDGTEEEFMGIAEGNLIALLTSAVKELSAEIVTLRQRLTALESSIDTPE